MGPEPLPFLPGTAALFLNVLTENPGHPPVSPYLVRGMQSCPYGKAAPGERRAPQTGPAAWVMPPQGTGPCRVPLFGYNSTPHPADVNLRNETALRPLFLRIFMDFFGPPRSHVSPPFKKKRLAKKRSLPIMTLRKKLFKNDLDPCLMFFSEIAGFTENGYSRIIPVFSGEKDRVASKIPGLRSAPSATGFFGAQIRRLSLFIKEKSGRRNRQPPEIYLQLFPCEGRKAKQVAVRQFFRRSPDRASLSAGKNWGGESETWPISFARPGFPNGLPFPGNQYPIVLYVPG